jgi:hypothetical protein
VTSATVIDVSKSHTSDRNARKSINVYEVMTMMGQRRCKADTLQCCGYDYRSRLCWDAWAELLIAGVPKPLVHSQLFVNRMATPWLSACTNLLFNVLKQARNRQTHIPNIRCARFSPPCAGVSDCPLKRAAVEVAASQARAWQVSL